MAFLKRTIPHLGLTIDVLDSSWDRIQCPCVSKIRFDGDNFCAVVLGNGFVELWDIRFSLVPMKCFQISCVPADFACTSIEWSDTSCCILLVFTRVIFISTANGIANNDIPSTIVVIWDIVKDQMHAEFR